MRKLLAASLLAGLLPLAATAGPIYGEFTGTVYGVSESGTTVPGGIGVGTTVTGSFQFENTGQAAYTEIGGGINESRYLSDSGGTFLRITIGSFAWEATGLSIGVRNDSATFGDDMLALIYSGGLVAYDPAFPPATSFPGVPAGSLNSSFGIEMFDTAGPLDLVSSQALPGSASDINLDSATIRTGSIFGNYDGANAFYAINFSLDSVTMRDVTTVPEPGTLPLSGCMLLGVWLFARRRLNQRSLF